MSVSWDLTQVDRLAADLGKGTAETVRDTRGLIEVTALKAKRAAQKRVAGLKHAPAYPSAITFDVHGLQAEIGPDKNLPQGPLGNILEFGTSKNGPIPHLGPALTEVGPAYVAGIAKIGEKGILG